MEWLATNKLTLNVKKTHFILFRNRGVVLQPTKVLTINGTPIKQESNTRFLGVYLEYL